MTEAPRTIHANSEPVKLDKSLVIAIACMLLVSTRTYAQSPLDHAHAHNDYVHARPLLDALDRGYGSVEADIYLVDGALLVAHARDSVRADRTLESLYLAPLRAWIGRVVATYSAASESKKASEASEQSIARQL